MSLKGNGEKQILIELDLVIPTLPHMCKVPRCIDEGSESVEVRDPAEVYNQSFVREFNERNNLVK